MPAAQTSLRGPCRKNQFNASCAEFLGSAENNLKRTPTHAHTHTHKHKTQLIVNLQLEQKSFSADVFAIQG